MDLLDLNGASVSYSADGSTAFIALPRALWRSCGGKCHCKHCNGREGQWDTLAVSTRPGAGVPTAWTVHRPEGNYYHHVDREGRYWTDPKTLPLLREMDDREFASWDEVVEHVSGGGAVLYHAPLDASPRAVRVRHVFKNGKLRIDPLSRDADCFTADAGHLSRFRRA